MPGTARLLAGEPARARKSHPNQVTVKGSQGQGPWRLSKNTTVAKALPEAFFVKTLGLVLPG